MPGHPRARTPEVAAFVHCADLQTAATAALAARPARSLQRRQQESLLFSLRLTASHFWKPADAVLHYRGNLMLAATDQLDALAGARLSGVATVEPLSTLGRQLGALLEQDRSLATLLAVAAALPNLKDLEHNADLLSVTNAVVSRLQQPLEAARVRQELAAAQAQLPAPVLSYEQLLALFVGFSRQRAMEVFSVDDEFIDVVEACRAAAELVPRLMPPHHTPQFLAAMATSLLEGAEPQHEF